MGKTSRKPKRTRRKPLTLLYPLYHAVPTAWVQAFAVPAIPRKVCCTSLLYRRGRGALAPPSIGTAAGATVSSTPSTPPPHLLPCRPMTPPPTRHCPHCGKTIWSGSRCSGCRTTRRTTGEAAASTHHILPRYRNPLDPAWQLRNKTTAAAPVTTTTYTSTPIGDHRVLRGIPALAPGVGGAIPGTLPHVEIQRG